MTQNALTDLGTYLRAQRELAEVSMRQMARVLKVSEGYLGKIEEGTEPPNVDLLHQMSEMLGLSPAAVLRRASTQGFLPTGLISVPDAIKADGRLNEAQRSALVQTYKAMVGEA